MIHTVQCFAGSLNDYTSLEGLKSKLQDIPRMLARNDVTENYLLGNVSGDFNYNFTFRLEGGGFFQTGVLVASALTPGGMPVPLKCRWRRKVDGHPIDIPSVTSNMYQISADDVGTEICVEAQPADMEEGLRGSAFGEIGPFELDPATRRSLDNALGVGTARFTAVSRVSDPDVSEREHVIHVTAERVRIVPADAKGSREDPSKEVSIEYGHDYPKVIIHPLDTSKFNLHMGDGRNFQMFATSRTTRDLIALTIRCFHARNYLPTAQLLGDLLPVQPVGPMNVGHQSTPAIDNRLDACIVLERLTKELNRSMVDKEVSEKVLRNTNHEKEQLQAQLMETITGFTEVIDDLQQQCAEGAAATCPAVSVDRLQGQLRDVQSLNQNLQAELKTIKQQLDEGQRARQAAEGNASIVTRDKQPVKEGAIPAATVQEVKQLREEAKLLQARHLELSTTSAAQVHQSGQADQVHTHELKRLRQDIDALDTQKGVLRQQLQDADRERQDLQENFLYVKGQLDKVQMRQAQAATGANDIGKELQKLRETLAKVQDEKSRCAVRVESVSKDVEKEKAYHEQSLERVMVANARLMEEKDRAEREVCRVSQLYAQSVQQLQEAECDVRDDAPADAASLEAEDEEMRQLKEQLNQLDEDIKRKDQENDNLKIRIRKLAVA
mmetsp:Transcript_35592/g.94681  ORF Transcript_35592/g.94681 Transcript_35592/m.94681 type:complete len:667 (-) Transcript_35592:111-2111(-)